MARASAPASDSADAAAAVFQTTRTFRGIPPRQDFPRRGAHWMAGMRAFPSFVAAARKETRRQVFVLPKNASPKNAPHDAVCEVARAAMPAFFRQSNPFAQDSQKSGDVFAGKTDAVVSGEAGLSG
jgi:hypothetical protein